MINIAEDNAGLCGACTHSRVVENARGSRFYLCRLSESDARFPKYPRLPVLGCDGYRPLKGEQKGRQQLAGDQRLFIDEARALC